MPPRHDKPPAEDEASADARQRTNGSAPPEPLEALPLTHADYLDAKLRQMDVQYDDGPLDYTALFTQKTLLRLRMLKDDDPALFEGKLRPWVSQRNAAWMPTLERMIAEAGTQHNLVFTDLADMLEREYPLPRWLIKDLIPEGLVFLVGSPKSSKTYLALSLALEVERGGEWFGRYPIENPGPVVYLTLEDSEAASRRRIATLAPSLRNLPRDRFIFVHGLSIPRFDDGLYDALKDGVIGRYTPSLIVLDPISYLYAPTRKNADQFSEVKDMLLPLHWLGHEHHCTIVGVDHRRKKSAEDIDIFETTYGSNAKSAVVDAMLMIVRENTDITVHAKLREAQDQTITLGLTFEQDGTATWTWKGEAEGLLDPGQYGDLRMKIVTLLTHTDIPISPKDIMVALELPATHRTRNSVDQVLGRLMKTEEILKTNRGLYFYAGALSRPSEKE